MIGTAVAALKIRKGSIDGLIDRSSGCQKRGVKPDEREGGAHKSVFPVENRVCVNEKTKKARQIGRNVVSDDSNHVCGVVEECHVELKHSNNILALLQVILSDLSASKESDFLCTEIEKDWVRQSTKALQGSRIKDEGSRIKDQGSRRGCRPVKVELKGSVGLKVVG